MDPNLEKFFDLSLDLLCIAGVDGIFRKVNPAFMETLGWTEQELLTRPFFDFVHPDDIEATHREVENLTRGYPTIRFENRYRCADGSYKHLRWTSGPDPETGMLYAVARDVTWQKELEAELLGAKEAAEAADRAKSAFLANISHEIRTPMSGILGMADLALERVADPDLEHSLDVIHQSAEALLALINDLLDLSKIEAGHIELENEPFSLRSLVGKAVRTLAIQAHKKGLELTLRIAPDLPVRVLGDPARLRQILVNLIGNAIKFTDKGEVKVRVAPGEPIDDGILVRFEVEDTGIGIAPDQIEHIFDPFWQVQRTPERSRGGTGLGLAICEQLVDQFGGALEVTSQLGSGSRFFFDAMLGEVANGEPAAASEDEMSALEGERVLVIDARASSRQVLLELLALWKLPVEAVSTRAQAKTAIEQARDEEQPFTLLIVDCALSEEGLNRIETLDEGDIPELRVVATLPSVRSPGSLRRCRSMGLAGYLIEPVVFSDVKALLRRISGLGPTEHRGIEPCGATHNRPLNVLLVEDSLINQLVIRALLESRGHTVKVVGDGRVAVDAFRSARWDLVLMDVGLPGLSGPEATREIRAAERPGSRTPIIAVTAHTGPEERARCREAGMDAAVLKPVRSKTLFEQIDAVLGQSRGSEADTGRTDKTTAERKAEPRQTPDSIDWALALQATGGDESLLDRLVEAAAEEIPVLLRDIEAAIADQNGEILARAAHTLKGSCRYFGVARLTNATEQLEKLASIGDFTRARKHLPTVVRQTGRLLDALSRSEAVGVGVGPSDRGDSDA